MFEELVDRFSPYAVTYDPADLPDIAYHYTNAAGLVGMLRSDAVWATEYRYLNDRSEILHTRSLVRKIVGERLKSKSAAALSRFHAGVLKAIDDPQDNTVAVFSLSTKRDDLSQWRGYARDGKGFTVGFDVETIARRGSESDAPFGFARVEYKAPRQEGALKKALDAVSKALLASDQSDGVMAEAIDAFDKIAWNRGIANKHNSFEAEEEWRIFAFLYNDSILKVRDGPWGLIPYVEFTADELAGGAKLPIKSIGVGPGFADKNQVSAVKALCRQYGYDPIVYEANAPYRSG